MYTLYWHPWSSSYAPMAVLEKLGVEFDLYEVDYDGGENLTPQYRRLQPLGLIPAMKIGHSGSMFESAAIILYLCDRHPEAGLAPAVDAPDRHAYLQWILFLADTIYSSYNRYYHPQRYTAAADGAPEVKRQANENALAQWRVIEDSLTDNGPWLLGHTFSACDIYLQMITTWHETPKDLFASFPRIKKLAMGVTQRERCQRAIKRHNFATGFEP